MTAPELPEPNLPNAEAEDAVRARSEWEARIDEIAKEVWKTPAEFEAEERQRSILRRNFSGKERAAPYIPGTVNPNLAGPVSLYAEGYERGVEAAKRHALLGHLLCALSGAAVGLLIGWWL